MSTQGNRKATSRQRNAQTEGGEEAMNWREHLRLVAILINGLFVVALIGWGGSWMSMGLLGLPMIVPPLLAVIALAVNSRHGLSKT